MNLTRLSFQQLYKLAKPETLMRVTAAYHTALRRRWDAAKIGEPFIVSHAAAFYPEVARAFAPVLKVLRGRELPIALRRAANRTCCPLTPGALFPLVRLDARRYPNNKLRRAHADLILLHCQNHHVPAIIHSCDFGEGIDWEIYIEAGPLTAQLLRYKSGPALALLAAHSAPNAKVMNVLWWIPQDAKIHATVNPTVWPANVPNAQEIGREWFEYEQEARA
jgi:hypothetical protein